MPVFSRSGARIYGVGGCVRSGFLPLGGVNLAEQPTCLHRGLWSVDRRGGDTAKPVAAAG